MVDEVRETVGTPPYDERISEDYRLLRYGLNTMELMTYMMSYYEALRSKNPAWADDEWSKIQRVARAMDSYWVPIGFKEDFYKLDLISKDALTRTQLKELIRKCKQYRRDNNLPVGF